MTAQSRNRPLPAGAAREVCARARASTPLRFFGVIRGNDNSRCLWAVSIRRRRPAAGTGFTVTAFMAAVMAARPAKFPKLETKHENERILVSRKGGEKLSLSLSLSLGTRGVATRAPCPLGRTRALSQDTLERSKATRCPRCLFLTSGSKLSHPSPLGPPLPRGR